MADQTEPKPSKPKRGRPKVERPLNSPPKPRGLGTVGRTADLLLKEPQAEGNPDDLLTGSELAEWLRMSDIWVATRRGNGQGPPFIMLTPNAPRYFRRSVIA